MATKSQCNLVKHVIPHTSISK